MKIQPIRQPWPGTMTGRERFRRQMNSQGVDRCVNMEFGYWDENFTEWKMFRDNGIRPLLRFRPDRVHRRQHVDVTPL